MPNHVTNRLEINADRETVQKVMNFLKGKTDDDNTPCYIDFNNIIPMPEELLIEKNSSGDFGMRCLEAMQRQPFYFLLDDDDLRAVQWMRGLAEKDRQEALQLGETYLENRKKYGYPTWFEWSIATWGTKWNAYNQSFEEPNILWFDTAWNGVPQLIQKLSENISGCGISLRLCRRRLRFQYGKRNSPQWRNRHDDTRRWKQRSL